MRTPRTLLIDADIMIYRIAERVQVPVELDGGILTYVVDEYAAQELVNKQVEHYTTELEATNMVLCFTGPTNFRKEILPTYKANRKPDRRPIAIPFLREYCKKSFAVYEKPLLEADDIMGILATHPKVIPGEKIIVSQDKDLKTVPGQVYNGELLMRITEEQADEYFYTQALIGDSTDGYSGCPGVGPKTALKHFEKSGYSWESVVAMYEKKGLTEGDALVQAQVARICRASDYDFKAQKPIPWTPQQENKP